MTERRRVGSTVFERRVALVTGGARGIGLAIATHLAQRGAQVVVMDNGASIDGRERDAQTLAAAADALGPRATVIDADVGDPEAVAKAMDRVEGEHGRLDILIHAAAILRDAVVAKIDEADFAEVLRVNLTGGLLVMRSGLPLLRESAQADDDSREPAILHLVSSAAFYGNIGVAAYAAAKAGLNAMTEGMAHAFGPRVRVNAIMCGPFLTDISKAWDMERFRERAKTFALGRGGEPEEVVGAALYFASAASSFCTGAILRLDGGTP